ncbi:unnamed protein product [Diabrotica balteata]|uniref:Uncharacterized protein n=1 Tax=Diabrotica balteata TaxID=107213 RepID=A0A9N9T2P5_DIABA|nr:unnamed protein product [Diabrotica balteata]
MINAKRTAPAELIVHKRRAKKFYTKLNEVKESSKTRPNVMGIVFDYMQNLPLPSLPVQEMFFLRKLWYYVFNVYDFKNDRAVFYTYPEGVANKGPDEVTSFVLDFLQNEIPAEITELHIFSDACGGQNRNHTMLLREQYEKYDRIYSPDQYKAIIENSKKIQPTYKVKEVKNEDVLACKKWWPLYFVKLPKSLEDKRISFAISKYSYLIHRSDRKGYVVASSFIGGFLSHTFKLTKSNDVVLPSSKAYDYGKVPIKVSKINDVMKLIKYIPEEYLPFYDERRTWPTTEAETSDENDEN